jgi:hypothetical protein
MKASGSTLEGKCHFIDGFLPCRHLKPFYLAFSSACFRKVRIYTSFIAVVTSGPTPSPECMESFAFHFLSGCKVQNRPPLTTNLHE